MQTAPRPANHLAKARERPDWKTSSMAAFVRIFGLRSIGSNRSFFRRLGGQQYCRLVLTPFGGSAADCSVQRKQRAPVTIERVVGLGRLATRLAKSPAKLTI